MYTHAPSPVTGIAGRSDCLFTGKPLPSTSSLPLQTSVLISEAYNSN